MTRPLTTTEIVPAIPGAVIASGVGNCHGREATGTACPATFTTSTRSFEMRPYRPACMVHGCQEIGGWILGSHGFRKLGDEKTVGLFCADHGFERLAALDPMRHGGAA